MVGVHVDVFELRLRKHGRAETAPGRVGKKCGNRGRSGSSSSSGLAGRRENWGRLSSVAAKVLEKKDGVMQEKC